MGRESSSTSDLLAAKASLTISGQRVQLEMTVPNGPTTPRRMLPIYRTVADSLVNTVVKAASKQGVTVSCKKGCGACCRQLVPISEIEAHQLSDLISKLLEPQRSKIIEKFQRAQERMEEAGLLETLMKTEQISEDEFRPLGLEYFAQGVACPFLENESCSIHDERPIVCREYLAVSPSENCSSLTSESVKCLKLPAKVSNAIRGIGEPEGPRSWVPLILALYWSSKNDLDEERERTGKDLLTELFMRLTGKDVNQLQKPTA